MKFNPRTNTIAQIQKTTWQDVPESGLRYHYHTVTYLTIVNCGTPPHYFGLQQQKKYTKAVLAVLTNISYAY